MTNPIATLVKAIKANKGRQSHWAAIINASEAALPALEAVLAQGWQDISTAPKDGRQLILLWNSKHQDRRPQTAYSNTWWTCGFSHGERPTHWMPLPEPPRSE